ncbi:MAG: hypothetical protein LBD04_12010 [Synergistaceae bacterium]|jgi:hypothetical protein|nr:hypothetical protein [Synergistaceae bacterium]
MKIRRKTFFILFLAFMGIGWLLGSAFVDYHLDAELLRLALQKPPTLVLENVEFERVISGDLWRLRSPLGERRGDLVELTPVDVWREMADGGEWYFHGERGFYSQETASVDVGTLTGTMETNERVLNLQSPRLSWSRNADEFFFPEGLVLYDAEFVLEADVASVDKDGAMLLEKGGVIRWTKVPQ